MDVPSSIFLPSPAAARACHVPCSHAFRRAVRDAAQQRSTTVARLVRAGLLIANGTLRPEVADPGPGGAETVQVVCRNGQARQVRRQAFLHVRLSGTAAELGAAEIRRVLATVLLLGEPGAASLEPASCMAAHRAAAVSARHLLQVVGQLAFQPMPDGVRSVRQAAYVLGLQTGIRLDRVTVASRFRLLAPLFHPDTGVLPDPERLRLLVDARNLLISHGVAAA